MRRTQCALEFVATVLKGKKVNELLHGAILSSLLSFAIVCLMFFVVVVVIVVLQFVSRYKNNQ